METSTSTITQAPQGKPAAKLTKKRVTDVIELGIRYDIPATRGAVRHSQKSRFLGREKGHYFLNDSAPFEHSVGARFDARKEIGEGGEEVLSTNLRYKATQQHQDQRKKLEHAVTESHSPSQEEKKSENEAGLTSRAPTSYTRADLATSESALMVATELQKREAALTYNREFFDGFDIYAQVKRFHLQVDRALRTFIRSGRHGQDKSGLYDNHRYTIFNLAFRSVLKTLSKYLHASEQQGRLAACKEFEKISRFLIAVRQRKDLMKPDGSSNSVDVEAETKKAIKQTIYWVDKFQVIFQQNALTAPKLGPALSQTHATLRKTNDLIKEYLATLLLMTPEEVPDLILALNDQARNSRYVISNWSLLKSIDNSPPLEAIKTKLFRFTSNAKEKKSLGCIKRLDLFYLLFSDFVPCKYIKGKGWLWVSIQEIRAITVSKHSTIEHLDVREAEAIGESIETGQFPLPKSFDFSFLEALNPYSSIVYNTKNEGLITGSEKQADLHPEEKKARETLVRELTQLTIKRIQLNWLDHKVQANFAGAQLFKALATPMLAAQLHTLITTIQALTETTQRLLLQILQTFERANEYTPPAPHSALKSRNRPSLNLTPEGVSFGVQLLSKRAKTHEEWEQCFLACRRPVISQDFKTVTRACHEILASVTPGASLEEVIEMDYTLKILDSAVPGLPTEKWREYNGRRHGLIEMHTAFKTLNDEFLNVAQALPHSKPGKSREALKDNFENKVKLATTHFIHTLNQLRQNEDTREMVPELECHLNTLLRYSVIQAAAVHGLPEQLSSLLLQPLNYLERFKQLLETQPQARKAVQEKKYIIATIEENQTTPRQLLIEASTIIDSKAFKKFSHDFYNGHSTVEGFDPRQYIQVSYMGKSGIPLQGWAHVNASSLELTNSEIANTLTALPSTSADEMDYANFIKDAVYLHSEAEFIHIRVVLRDNSIAPIVFKQEELNPKHSQSSDFTIKDPISKETIGFVSQQLLVNKVIHLVGWEKYKQWRKTGKPQKPLLALQDAPPALSGGGGGGGSSFQTIDSSSTRSTTSSSTGNARTLRRDSTSAFVTPLHATAAEIRRRPSRLSRGSTAGSEFKEEPQPPQREASWRSHASGGGDYSRSRDHLTDAGPRR